MTRVKKRRVLILESAGWCFGGGAISVEGDDAGDRLVSVANGETDNIP